MSLATSQPVESSQTRDQTCDSCIGRQILNHWNMQVSSCQFLTYRSNDLIFKIHFLFSEYFFYFHIQILFFRSNYLSIFWRLFFFPLDPLRFLLCAFRFFSIVLVWCLVLNIFLMSDDLETSIQIKEIDIFETRQEPMETYGLPNFLLSYEGRKLPSHWE